MRVGFGQDSHKFDLENTEKKLVLGGVVFPGEVPLEGNSDADVVLHALTNAVSSVTCVNILGKIADDMCLIKGITDSKVYLKEALKYLKDSRIIHTAISIECAKPKISSKIPEIRSSVAKLLEVPENSVGITATSGEGLTAFGQGLGIQAMAIITVL